MAKASKKRSKKKSAKKKSAGKRRKSSRKGKSAPRKSSRKSVRRKPAKKRAPARKAPAQEAPPPATDPAWPVLFATLFAFLAGLAAAWVFGDFSTAANAAALSSAAMAEPVHACAVQAVQAAETWLALAHPEFVPTLH